MLKEAPDHPLSKSCLADLYLHQGRLVEARILAEEALAQDPQQVQGLTILGDVFLRQHSPQGALECYRQAYSRDPRPYLSLRIARSLKEMENFEEALLELEKVLVVMPQSCFFLKEKAMILNRMKRFDEALQLYEKIREACPADPFVQKEILRLRSRTRTEGQVIKELKAVVAMDSKKDNPQIHGLLAQKLKEAGLISEAIAEYRAAAGLEPKNVYFRKQQGFCHYRLKEYHQAIQLLAESFQKDPADYVTRKTLEKSYEAIGNLRGFLDLLEDTLHQHPQNKSLLGTIKRVRKKLSMEEQR